MTPTMPNEAPDNLALAREAAETQDAERQMLLASHPSEVVRYALSKNPHLIPEVEELLKNEIDQLRGKTGHSALATAKTKD